MGKGGRIYIGRECEDVGNQRTYLECLTSQAIFWVETALAAMMRSPSFSLLSSSITTRNSPRAKASIASSIGSNAKLSRTGTSGTSCGREDDAVAGMSGKSSGWVPFILIAGLDGVWEVERDDEDLVISRFATLRVDDKENDCPSVQRTFEGRSHRRNTRRYNPY